MNEIQKSQPKPRDPCGLNNQHSVEGALGTEGTAAGTRVAPEVLAWNPVLKLKRRVGSQSKGATRDRSTSGHRFLVSALLTLEGGLSFIVERPCAPWEG